VDLCVRLRAAGWDIAYTPAAEIVHHGGQSAGAATSRVRLAYDRSHWLFYCKHNGVGARLLLRGLLALRGLAACARGASSWGYARALIRLALGPRPREWRHVATERRRVVR